MHRYRNIAVTGSRGAGKTTLLCRLLERMDAPFSGFRTVCREMTAFGPLYDMQDIATGATAPISHCTEAGIRGIPETFDTFGADCIARGLAGAAPVLLLDEIGRFERNSPRFLNAVFAALDSDKTVLLALKQEPLPHIRAIRQRRDTLVLDLDTCSRAQAREILDSWLKKS